MTIVLYLVPYFLEVLGAILVAMPWLQDQRYRHLFDAGNELLKSDQGDVARLGGVLRRNGLHRLIGVDEKQKWFVKVGIGLLLLSFIARACFAVWVPKLLHT